MLAKAFPPDSRPDRVTLVGANVKDSAPIPAVVVGGADNGGGLGLVRSLGRAGVPVIVVDRDASAPALHSRYARRFVVPYQSDRSLIRALLDLRSTLDAR